MPSADELIQVATNAIEAFSNGDWAAMEATMTPNSVYEESATQRRVEGPAAIIEVMEGWKQAFPDARGEIKNAAASGDQVILEIVWQGTQTGPLEAPGGTIPASGKPITTPAAQVLTLEGDKLKEIHHYFDLMGMLQQIGALPAAAS
jgi:steroid delta-isomerase-like uncharacterized protein